MTVQTSKPSKQSVTVINGAYGGMGSAMARSFAKRGDALVLLGRDQKKLEALKNELQQLYPHANINNYLLDVSCKENFEKVAAAVAMEFGSIDNLINTVGTVVLGNVLDITDEEWQSSIETRLMGTIRLVKSFAPALIKNKSGSIVLINGTLSLQPDPDIVVGSVAAAINHFSKAISKTLGAYNVRVNVINPGATDTSLWEKMASEMANRLGLPDSSALTQQVIKGNPLGRIGTTDDIVNIVEFLTSMISNFINGAFITVDGGSSVAF